MNQRVEDGDEVYGPCPECRGSGRFGASECSHCGGSGQVSTKSTQQREAELTAAAEYGKKLAEKNKPDLTGVVAAGAMVVLIGDIYRVLVEKGLLTQGDAISRLEKLSSEVMASDTAASRGLAVALIDTVRDTIANELGRKPS
jgi:hypothetical protein